ncbi:MAG: hypothetical protein ACFFC7_19170 [Candidatus Hermodarchaeota archaeon]
MGLSSEEDQVIKTLQEHRGVMSYKKLNDILSEKFEGVRLILKRLKTEGLIDFEGTMPSFDSVIRLR